MSATLVAVAMLSSSWALTPLFTRPGWQPDLVVMLTLVAVSGIVARQILGRRIRVVALQAVATLLGLGALFAGPVGGASTLGLGLLPTPATLGHWATLMTEAVATIRGHAAPAPATTGVSFLVVSSIAVLAVVSDALAVTLGAPAVAGLTLMAPFLVSVANSDGSMAFGYFAVPTVCWLALLVHDDGGTVARWLAAAAGAEADRRPGTRRAALARRSARLHSRLGPQRWAGALVLGLLAVATAGAGASLVPHLPVRYLAEGLGRGPGSNQIRFSPNLDLISDLRDPTDAPVLEYRTNDPNPPPLRVSVASEFRNGQWWPQRVNTTPSRRPQLPPPPGLDQHTPRAQYSITVERTGLAAPHLAIPYPLVGGTVTDAQWSVDPATGVAVTNRTPREYTMPYVAVTPDRQVLRKAHAPGVEPEQALHDVGGLDDEVLLDELSAATASAYTPYDKAVAIQDWFRSYRFTYSLELTPPPPGMTREEAERTAITRFLRSRRGYCVQFASAMALMARQEGIPARVVTGFLPGTKQGDVWQVRASDAHAWPELFFEGAGWLRFEPTPASRVGTPPSYATEEPSAAAATPRPRATAGSGSDSPRTSPRGDTTEQENQASPDLSQTSGPDWRLGWVIGLVLLTVLLLTVLPASAWLSVHRRRRRAEDDSARIEAQWLDLTTHLSDLGLAPPPASTLAQQHRFYTHAADLQTEPNRALGRICATVEQARYAPNPVLPDLSGDVVTVKRAVGRSRRPRIRLNALLWPRSGRRALRAACSRLRPGSAETGDRW